MSNEKNKYFIKKTECLRNGGIFEVLVKVIKHSRLNNILRLRILLFLILTFHAISVWYLKGHCFMYNIKDVPEVDDIKPLK